MYTYNKDQLLAHFSAILQCNINDETWRWLTEITTKISAGDRSSLYTAFSVAPRRAGKALLQLSDVDRQQVENILPGFTLKGYSADRLVRVWFLLNWPSENKEDYIKTVSQLFKAAEMNELVALYGALPLYPYPEEWTGQCSEGIRSNIGNVLEAIICDNPYPSKYLSEPAWNQLVLKAFFTDKPIERIIGLDQRANKALADTLFDYAHERWAAHRTFDRQLWRLIAKFIDEQTYPDIRRVFFEGDEFEKKAVALACAQSTYKPAIGLLNEMPALKSAIEKNELNWEGLAQTIKADAI